MSHEARLTIARPAVHTIRIASGSCYEIYHGARTVSTTMAQKFERMPTSLGETAGVRGGFCRGSREFLPGKRGLWVGERGRNPRGNRNTAAAVHYNAARR